MTIRIIDDHTAQEIYETIAKQTKRSFSHYGRPRALPKQKIPGELAFFLDNLLEFAATELEQESEEALAEVIDRGITAWYASLAPEMQKNLKLPPLPIVSRNRQDELAVLNSKLDKSKKREQKALNVLEIDRRKRATEIRKLIDENASIKDEIEKLKQENQKLKDQKSTAYDQLETEAKIPAFLDRKITQTDYIPMTAHTLNNKQKNKTRRNKRQATP